MKAIPKHWLFIAILIHLLAAWFSVGHYHDDEYYQILDLAAFKLGFEIQNNLMWEYGDQVRSGLQPFIAYIVTRTSMLLGVDSPFLWALSLRIISAAISLLSLVIFINSIRSQINSETIEKWMIFFLLFSWLLIFMNVRFSAEGWGMSLFILAYAIYLNPASCQHRKFFYAGLLFGFSFLARYQLGFLLLGLGSWMLFIQRDSLRNISILLLGGSIALLTGFIVDYWFYGSVTSSAWNIFEWHMIKGALDNIEHEPWWFYAYYSAVQLIPPVTLLLPLVVILFWIIFPKHSITWLTIPFILFHHYFGHKEMRYLFPVLPFAPVMFAMLLEKLIHHGGFFKTKRFKSICKTMIGLSVFVNFFLVLLVISLPASKEVALWNNCLEEHLSLDKSILFVYDSDGSGTAPGELELDFYNVGNVPVIAVSDEQQITQAILKSPDKQFFYASRKKNRTEQLEHENISHQLICRALPDWLLKININNWTSRASIWRVWELKTQ